MRAVPSLETGKNREERREQSYRLVFTLLTREGTGPKALGVTVGSKPMCACLFSFGGAILTGGPPALFWGFVFVVGFVRGVLVVEIPNLLMKVCHSLMANAIFGAKGLNIFFGGYV